MLRTCIPALALLALPAFAHATEYTPPAPGTKLVYGVYEGGETPTVTRTEIVVTSDATGYIAQVATIEGTEELVRYLYGVTSYPCFQGYHVFGDGIDAIWPFEAGKSDEAGAFFVIGRDIDAWVAGTAYETWAVREQTEHGSTWVTRVSADLGIPMDDLVAIETGPVPEVDSATLEACTAD